MKVCQKLYEKGLITYMRTTSKQLSKKFQNNVKDYLSDKYNTNLFTKIDNTEEHAHEAIRPTDINKKTLDKSFSLIEQKVYKLIWKISIQSLMKDAILLKHTFKINAPYDLEYSLTLEEPVELNWMIFDTLPDKLTELHYLNNFVNKSIKNKKISTDISVKNQKQYYTEAKLVNVLEDYGIGRPSTFSSIIKNLKN